MRRATWRNATVNLYEINVCCPEDLEIADSMRNGEAIERWWATVKVVAKTLHGLDRAVLLHYDEGGGWYFSSVPSKIAACVQVAAPKPKPSKRKASKR